jgi:hypothetical protein
VLVRQILGATTRWSPSGGCDGSARVGKAQAAAAGRRIGPGPKELPHPKDGKNPLNSRKNPPSPSEDSFMDPSVLSPDLIPIMVKKSKNIKNRLTCFASLGSPITRHPSIQRFPQLSRPPRNHRHAQRCHQRPHDRQCHASAGRPPTPGVVRRAVGAEWGEQGGCGRLWAVVGGCGRLWAGCHPDVHHRTHWCPSTRRSFRGNSDKSNLPIKSKRKLALQINHQIN